MTPERWERVKALFDSAVSCDAAGRAAFLAAACRDDPSLITEVSSLLEAHEEGGVFLDTELPPLLEAGELVAGRFEVVAFIARGGAGEVYEVKDRELGEHVALKLLRPELAADPLSVERVKREIHLARRLSHPNVCRIFELGVHRGEGGARPFLTMELLRGETLAEILRSGPLPSTLSLRIGRQIAEALEEAHRRGIVHRDLKPANVKVTPDGTLKVLDFGLAKAIRPDGAAESPTASLTRGLVMGTAPYMSPEQARGDIVDRRADLWSFGCVLYEMWTGRRAFDAPTLPDTLVAVLTREPDWTCLPAETPPSVRRLLRRCLTKDPTHRLHDAGDARLELDDAVAGDSTAADPGHRSLRRPALAVLAVLAVATAALGSWPGRSPRDARPRHAPRRLNVALPPGVRLLDFDAPGALALSPSGSHLAYLGAEGDPSRPYQDAVRIHLRHLDSLATSVVAGTEGARSVFFSPDGQWIGFTADGKLRKVPLAGGTPITLADAPSLRGASWGPDNTIVFAPVWSGGLKRVHGEGGPVSDLTQVDVGAGEVSHRWPAVLPSGRTAVFNVSTGIAEGQRSLWTVDLATGVRRKLVDGGTAPRYLAPGYLVYARTGLLLGAPFDGERLLGAPAPVLEDLRMASMGTGQALFDVSAQGMLAFVPGYPRPPRRQLVWVDRAGQATPVVADAHPYLHPALSPDGRRIAVAREEGSTDLWTLDLETRRWLRLTQDAGDNSAPVWSPDGRYLYFGSTRHGRHDVYRIAADGSTTAEPLTKLDTVWAHPASVAAGGREILFTIQSRATGRDILGVATVPGSRERMVVGTPGDEFCPRASPDGRWLAYTGHDGGIHVRALDGSPPRVAVSHGPGVGPLWARNGRELFFRRGDAFIAVGFESGAVPRPGRERELFRGPFEFGGEEYPNYDVALDGRRFLMITAPRGRDEPLQIALAVNWADEVAAALSRR